MPSVICIGVNPISIITLQFLYTLPACGKICCGKLKNAEKEGKVYSSYAKCLSFGSNLVLIKLLRDELLLSVIDGVQ